MSTPAERPILFSTAMVQAILEGRKTQTRRVVKPQPDENGARYMSRPPFIDWEHVYKETWKPWHWDTEEGESISRPFSPYGQPGDLLWVKETWQNVLDEELNFSHCCFKASPETYADLVKLNDEEPMWKPSIFLRKADARIWLRITNMRVERLQEISAEDAKAEGVKEYIPITDITNMEKLDFIVPSPWSAHQFSFLALWCKINGAASWTANPWVWVISFEVISTTGRP